MRILPTLAATAILACSTATAADFSAQSADLKPGATIAPAQVYRGYGCQGNNTAPQIAWRNAPAGTRSFALTLFDPDANAGKGWWHWLVVDIPASAKSLSAGGKLPQGAFSLHNDFGEAGYGGPCPPPGDKPHHYVLTVYALDTDHLPLTATSKPDTARATIEKHALAQASITARYGR